MTQIAVHGAAGRMGSTAVAALLQHPTLSLAATWEHPQHEHLGKDIGTLLGGKTAGILLSPVFPVPGIDMVLDYSLPDASTQLVTRCAEEGLPCLIGTTGQTEAQLQIVAEAAQRIAILLAPNTSVGIAILRSAVERIATLLPDHDVEIVETHHAGKRDAPSGTALMLAKALQDRRGKGAIVLGRSGDSPRARGDIAIASLRGGKVPGVHEVHLLGEHESLMLSHHALDREGLAQGALQVAPWLLAQSPGLYTMQEALGLS